jgi:hypothetical protein
MADEIPRPRTASPSFEAAVPRPRGELVVPEGATVIVTPQPPGPPGPPPPPPVTPLAPTALTATAGDMVVTLAWTHSVTPSIVEQRVYRNGLLVPGGTLGPAVTGYTDGSVVNGTTYAYTVRAVTTVESPDSNAVSATPQSTTTGTAPLAPTALSASAGNGLVALAWTPSVTAGVTEQRIYRAGIRLLPGTLPPSATGYTDTTALNGTLYSYTIRAFNGLESPDSNQVTAMPHFTGTYSVNSPHWPHAHFSTFYSWADGLANVQWIAEHMDYVSADRLVGHVPDGYLAYNSTIKWWNYQFDLTMYATVNGLWGVFGTYDADDSAFPESAFLHFAEDTELTFYIGPTVPGLINCSGPYPAGGNGCENFSTTHLIPGGSGKANRMVVELGYHTQGGQPSWLFNVADPSFQTVYTSASWVDPTNPQTAGGLFLDLHRTRGFGKSAVHYAGSRTRLVSGGGILEYPNGVGGYYNLIGDTPAEGGADTAYQADITAWGAVLRAAWPVGQILMPNTNNSEMIYQEVRDEILAYKGMHGESLNVPSNMGIFAYNTLLPFYQSVAAVGGYVDFVGAYGAHGTDHADASNYNTIVERYWMWSYINYLVFKEPAGSPGVVALALAEDSQAPWQTAFEVNVGLPSTAAVLSAFPGFPTDPLTGEDTYLVTRDFPNAYVLVRPYHHQTAGADTSVTYAHPVTLPGQYRLLRADGSLGPPTNTISLAYSDAVIMMKP